MVLIRKQTLIQINVFLFCFYLVVLRLIKIPAVLRLVTATERSKIISYSSRHINYGSADPVS